MTRIKQVIVIRRDLKMRRGKEIAQGSHASAAFLTRRIELRSEPRESAAVTLQLNQWEQQWLQQGTAKVCVRVDSEDELKEVHTKARAAGLESQLIRDSGKTEFGGVPTLTACAIGPAPADLLDPITGHLKLY